MTRDPRGDPPTGRAELIGLSSDLPHPVLPKVSPLDRLSVVATVQVTYGDGTTEGLETDDVQALLAELDSVGWVDRGSGQFSRVVDIRILDDARYEENLRKLRESRPAFGRGFARGWPPSSGTT